MAVIDLAQRMATRPRSGPGVPAIIREKVTLRVLGASVTLLPMIRERAMADLGIRLDFRVLDGLAAQREGVIANDSFDIYDQWFHNLDFLWPARTIQPLDMRRFKHWDQIDSLATRGRIADKIDRASGGRPVDRLYVQNDGSPGPHMTDRITMLPICHCADSFAYLPEFLPEELRDQPESWAWLVHPAWRGKVGLQNDPSIGAIDAAIALEAAGRIKLRDIGNLSLDEITELCEIIGVLRDAGQFAGFWGTPSQAASMLQKGRARIATIWLPTFAHLRRQAINLRVAAPLEGYRGWYGGLSISSRTAGRELDAAYEYMNWWTSGWAGAVISRQGHFSSTPDLAKVHLSPEEWAYWYAGQAATQDLQDPLGNVIVKKSELRSGGSRIDQMSKIRVWNAAMDEQNFLTRKWHQHVVLT